MLLCWSMIIWFTGSKLFDPQSINWLGPKGPIGQLGSSGPIGIIKLSRLMEKWRSIKWFDLSKIFLEIVIVPAFIIIFSYLICYLLLCAKGLGMSTIKSILFIISPSVRKFYTQVCFCICVCFSFVLISFFLLVF